jgi:hypothetical protein
MIGAGEYLEPVLMYHIAHQEPMPDERTDRAESNPELVDGG